LHTELSAKINIFGLLTVTELCYYLLSYAAPY
jgi:hypothetical protein